MELVRQRYGWDCGVACVATALGISWEDARELFPDPMKDGYYPSHVAAALNSTHYNARGYLGSLERAVLQVSVRSGAGSRQHFVYCDDGLHDPQGILKGWADVCCIRSVIPLTNETTRGG